jgi:hypothetical protein
MSEKPVNNSMTQLELCNFLTTSVLNKKFLHILFGVIKTKIPTVCLVDVALLIKRTLLTLSTLKTCVPFHFNYLHDTPCFTIYKSVQILTSTEVQKQTTDKIKNGTPMLLCPSGDYCNGV